MQKKAILYLAVFSSFVGCFLNPLIASAHQPDLVYLQKGDIYISNPEISQAFYDELKGSPRDYFIDSDVDFELYAGLLVPAQVNRNGRYSARIYLSKPDGGQQIAEIDGSLFDWKEYYEDYGRDWYMKGPDLTMQVAAGKYKIEVYSSDNQGKYVLAIGKKEVYGFQDLLNIYWQLPVLKLTFFKTSAMQFFLTPFGIGGIGAIGGVLIMWALINYLIGVFKMVVKHNQAKTLLLTSGGMLPMQDEIIKLLQKPAYDVTVAFVSTAAKPQENIAYLRRDWDIMKDMGFNIEEIDIEGKTESQVMKLLELKDIIFVEGGNTFYLLKAMRACKFEKVARKLLKKGKVYIGVSAGSIVAGRSIKTSEWLGDENLVGLKNLKGLNLVPFDIFVHYTPEYAEIIEQKMPNPKKRLKNLKIITEDQGILVQGKEVDLIGDGEAVVI